MINAGFKIKKRKVGKNDYSHPCAVQDSPSPCI